MSRIESVQFQGETLDEKEGSTKLLSNSRHTEFKFSAGRVNQPISSLFELCMYLGRIGSQIRLFRIPLLLWRFLARSPVLRLLPFFRFSPSHLSPSSSLLATPPPTEDPFHSRPRDAWPITRDFNGLHARNIFRHPRKRQTSLSLSLTHSISRGYLNIHLNIALSYCYRNEEREEEEEEEVRFLFIFVITFCY